MKLTTALDVIINSFALIIVLLFGLTLLIIASIYLGILPDGTLGFHL